jgi:hypothetical protein
MIGVLSGCLPTMPMNLWCQLLPQIDRQLLLLCQSKANPNILAYAHVYGHHDYNCHPFIPIGMEALVNNQHHKYCLFAQHFRKAFVLGTSTKHYRCWKFWLVTMSEIHISDAAFFKHKYLTNPMVTPEDRVIKAVGALARALDNQMPPTHVRIHHRCPQQPPRYLPTGRHQLKRRSRHSCRPSSTSKCAP